MEARGLPEEEAIRYLALDLGTSRTGYAVADWGDDLNGFEKVSQGVVESKHPDRMERVVEIADTIHRIVSDQGVGEVAIEEYGWAAEGGQQAMGEVRGAVCYVLKMQGVPYRTIPISTWKRLVLGKGSLPKDSVKLEFFRQYGIEASQDELDAVGVLMAAWMQWKGLDAKPKKVRRPAKSVMEGF